MHSTSAVRTFLRNENKGLYGGLSLGYEVEIRNGFRLRLAGLVRVRSWVYESPDKNSSARMCVIYICGAGCEMKGHHQNPTGTRRN